MWTRSLLFASMITVVGSVAQAQDYYYRGGHVCQRASSGYIVCRDPRDRWSEGYVVGRERDRSSSDIFYRRNGDRCQRASSGNIVCRDPRDRWSNGYVLR